jgi:hypothetical protein
MECSLDVGEGDVDDRCVKERHERTRAAHREYGSAPQMGPRRI